MLGADGVRILTGRSRFEVRFIVGNLHVGTSARAVVRHLWDRIPADERGPAKREIRRAFYRYAVLIHNRNRRAYVRLMNGGV